ncbi:MAG: transposase [Anaerolineae bacterium]|nr:transposase [Anaerolineae bacterium]
MNNQTPYPQRKSPRLANYDYSHNGAYFVTICTKNRANLFGAIGKDGLMHPKEWGDIAHSCWLEIPDHFCRVVLDVFVIMPNHMHGILFLLDISIDGEQKKLAKKNVGAIHESPLHTPQKPRGSKKDSLSAVVGLYKSTVARRINNLCEHPRQIWQRSFHDHIIRNETSLNKLREYVLCNPALWAEDRYFRD